MPSCISMSMCWSARSIIQNTFCRPRNSQGQESAAHLKRITIATMEQWNNETMRQLFHCLIVCIDHTIPQIGSLIPFDGFLRYPVYSFYEFELAEVPIHHVP